MRASGILLPISSLPSPYGIGTLGKEAFAFVDFLKKAGQSYWQVLPLGPTSYGDSPYQTFWPSQEIHISSIWDYWRKKGF